MAQTLAALTALSTPVIHSDFTTKHLDQCLAAIDNLPIIKLKAITLASMAYELNAQGGTNYVSPANFRQLDQDAVVLFGGWTLLDQEASWQLAKAEAVFAWNEAVASGATLSSNVNTLISSFPGSLEKTVNQCNLMILLLRYKLAVLGR
jgi:hypothetical protein